MNTASEQKASNDAAKIINQTITQIPKKTAVNPPPSAAKGDDDIMSKQEKQS